MQIKSNKITGLEVNADKCPYDYGTKTKAATTS
jgi:hypothetical protein